MFNRLRQLLPSPTLIIIVALLFCATFLWPSHHEFPSLEEHDLEVPRLIIPTQAVTFRSLILCVFSLYLGFLRAWRFHPSANKQYQQWLAFTPWTHKKPLPFGPPHLVLLDVLILAVITVIGYFTTLANPQFSTFLSGVYHPISYAVAFLAAYIMCQLYIAIVLNLQLHIGLIVLYIIPFAIYPFRDIRVAFLVLLAIYLVEYIGIRQYLRAFPWNTSFWKNDPVKDHLDTAITQKVIPWPHSELNTADRSDHVSFTAALLLAALATWWLHVFLSLDPEAESTAAPLLFMLIFFPLLRLGFYGGLRWSPLSLFGRIATGRLIIPQYDRVFIAPALAILLGLIMPMSLYLWNIIAIDLAYKVATFLTILLTLSLPPTLKQWRLTGAYRLVRPPKSRKQQPPKPATPVNTLLDRITTSKTN